MAITLNPRDGHELITLLRLPARILDAMTGHYPHTPGVCEASHCQGPVIQGQVPRENTEHASGCCKITPASAASGSPRIPIMTTIPLPTPRLSEQKSLNQPLL